MEIGRCFFVGDCHNCSFPKAEKFCNDAEIDKACNPSVILEIRREEDYREPPTLAGENP